MQNIIVFFIYIAGVFHDYTNTVMAYWYLLIKVYDDPTWWYPQSHTFLPFEILLHVNILWQRLIHFWHWRERVSKTFIANRAFQIFIFCSSMLFAFPYQSIVIGWNTAACTLFMTYLVSIRTFQWSRWNLNCFLQLSQNCFVDFFDSI